MYPADGVITTNATLCPTKCWYPVDGVQHMLFHPARRGAGCNYRVDGLHLTQPGAGCTPSMAQSQQMLHPVQPSAGTPSTAHSICYYTLPDQVLDVIKPSTGYSKCHTLPDQVLDVPRRRGNYNKCYTLPDQVRAPGRRGAAYAITPWPTRCWM